MKPKGSDKSNYIGVEIECFGKCKNRLTLQNQIVSLDSRLKGKVHVGSDCSIRPTKCKSKYKIKINNAPMSIDGYFGCVRGRYPNSIRVINTHTNTIVEDFSFKVTNDYRKNTKSMNKIYSISSKYGRKNREEKATGIEIRLLINQKHYKTLVPKVYRFLKKKGFKVNKSCGLHVHLDMRNRDVDECYRLLSEHQDSMLYVNPKRRNNRYCRRSPVANKVQQTSRYSIVNGSSYTYKKTIEVRVGTATMEGGRVVAWIKMLLSILESDVILDKKYKYKKYVLKNLGLKEKEINLLTKPA